VSVSDCSPRAARKGNSDFNQGRKAETLQDYDAALGYYQKALKADPYNANYKIKLNQTRFEAGQAHIKQGVELRKRAICKARPASFQRAQAIDPSSPVAEQELRKTVELIAEKAARPMQRGAGGGRRSAASGNIAAGNQAALACPHHGENVE